jgi:1-deoxy-D-xylulose-5-phosphate synthase
MQHLPVVFALDRAGLVGQDGPTHHGALDLAYLSCIQGMVVAAPRHGTEFKNLLYTALAQDQHPFAIRYPKDTAIEYDPAESYELIPIGRWQRLRSGSDVALLAVGTMVPVAEKAAHLLAAGGVDAEVINARFVKPLDEAELTRLCAHFPLLVTLEEGVLSGGFGSHVATYCQKLSARPERIIHFGLPDEFVSHGPRAKLLADVQLTPEAVVAAVRQHQAEPRLRDVVANRLTELS